jgi:uncharacterized protein YqjF (DUF2071 family)
MKQIWHHLLFAHWPINIKQLQPFIPEPLQIDTYEGQAWIGVVPFTMSDIRLKYLPPVPFTSRFAEINVRTYVTINNKPGVLFFSLDAASLLAVKVAQTFYHLPYYHAEMLAYKEKDVIQYRSQRIDAQGKYQFIGRYQPVSGCYQASKGTLEYWLTERYCLYTSHQNTLYRCNIHHNPWELQAAECEIEKNTMVHIEGFKMTSKPLLHYSDRIEVSTWGLEKVQTGI